MFFSLETKAYKAELYVCMKKKYSKKIVEGLCG